METPWFWDRLSERYSWPSRGPPQLVAVWGMKVAPMVCGGKNAVREVPEKDSHDVSHDVTKKKGEVNFPDFPLSSKERKTRQKVYRLNPNFRSRSPDFRTDATNLKIIDLSVGAVAKKKAPTETGKKEISGGSSFRMLPLSSTHCNPLPNFDWDRGSCEFRNLCAVTGAPDFWRTSKSGKSEKSDKSEKDNSENIDVNTANYLPAGHRRLFLL